MDVSWTIKKAKHWRNDTFELVLEKTLESPLDCKIKPINPKGNHSWIFIRGTNAEAEVPILWPPDAKSWLIGKDPDAGKDWKQEEKGTTEDEMVGWHHDSMDMRLSKLREIVKDRKAWCTAVHGVTKSRTWINNWTTITTRFYILQYKLRNTAEAISFRDACVLSHHPNIINRVRGKPTGNAGR